MGWGVTGAPLSPQYLAAEMEGGAESWLPALGGRARPRAQGKGACPPPDPFQSTLPAPAGAEQVSHAEWPRTSLILIMRSWRSDVQNGFPWSKTKEAPGDGHSTSNRLPGSGDGSSP